MSQQSESIILQGGDFETILPLDLGAMLRVVWHGKWHIILINLCCILLGGYYAFGITAPQFTATATLQVDAQSAQQGDVS